MKANKAKEPTPVATSSHPPQSRGGPPPTPTIQTTYKQQQEFGPADQQHPPSASLGSGSSGMGSTPTQTYLPYQVTYPSSDTRQTERDSLNESTPDADDAIYPARVVDKETKRHSSFFTTILNPPDSNESAATSGERTKSERHQSQPVLAMPRPIVLDPNVQDPIAAGLLDEQEAKVLFDLYVVLNLVQFCRSFRS